MGGDSETASAIGAQAYDWSEIAALRPQVLRFVRRMTDCHSDAEDLTQRTMIEALEKIDGFRGESSLATWVKGVALNIVRRTRRTLGRRAETTLDEMTTPIPADDPDAEQHLASRSDLAAVSHAMRGLPEGYAEVVVAVCIEEMSYQEAAACLGLPVGTVRSRLSRARLLLAECLAGEAPL